MDKAKGIISKMLNFDTMITPMIIKFIYALFSGLGMLIGFFIMVSGITARYGGGIKVFGGLILVLVSPFLLRVTCESLIVIFKINENLSKMANEGKI
ncbi:MAG: DUF4282 domain-containing protein [Bacilli bacterium]|nr:DUF4282 domain-containing protein [Bacilli bacterium]